MRYFNTHERGVVMLDGSNRDGKMGWMAQRNTLFFLVFLTFRFSHFCFSIL